jgi:hypothetical protein
MAAMVAAVTLVLTVTEDDFYDSYQMFGPVAWLTGHGPNGGPVRFWLDGESVDKIRDEIGYGHTTHVIPLAQIEGGA